MSSPDPLRAKGREGTLQRSGEIWESGPGEFSSRYDLDLESKRSRQRRAGGCVQRS